MSCKPIPERTPSGEAFTRLVLETFRLNGELLTAENRLTKEFGLSSALWQALGAIDDAPLSVARIARNMGLTRQSVRRTANVLRKRGFVTFDENPDHKRAKLVVLTEIGRDALDRVSRAQVSWADKISEGLTPEEIETAVRIINRLCERL